MEKAYGYAGNILFVDLTEKSITTRPLAHDLALGFLGGCGLNTRLAYEFIQPGEDPLGPGNALIFGVGPFVGTTIPGAARWSVAAKSPSSGFLATSGACHFPTLKFAGYDHLVMKGKAEKPVYIRICDGRTEIRDATHLWGKDVWETSDAVWAEIGRDYVVSCIGPAGENLVADAAIVCNKYAAFAAAGMGAVMGSKNIKAIAICGTMGVKVADPDRYSRLADKMYEVMRALSTSPDFQARRDYGSARAIDGLARLGFFPSRNWSGTTEAEEVIACYDREVFHQKFRARGIACMSCPVGCKQLLRLKEGKYAGLVLPISCGAVATLFFGGNCGIKDRSEIWRCHELCNRLGLDIISTANLISFAIELYQRGIIDREDTSGLVLDWGASDAIQKLIRQIACKEGLGQILAEGIGNAPKYIGKNSQDYAFQIKGVSPYYDPRVKVIPTTLQQSTNIRGTPTFSSIRVPTGGEELERVCRKIRVPEGTLKSVLQDANGSVGRLSRWFADYALAMESLGSCTHLSIRGSNMDIDIDVWADVYSALTGIRMSANDLLSAAANAHDVGRAFNIREGASRKDDTLPKRCLAEPLRVGNEVRAPVDKGYFDRMVTEYYEERGWDPDQGTVSKEKMRALGLA